MNLKGFGRNRSWSNRGTIAALAWRDRREPGRISGEPVSRPRFDPSTSRIQVLTITSRLTCSACHLLCLEVTYCLHLYVGSGCSEGIIPEM
jgi:hypothetical protein